MVAPSASCVAMVVESYAPLFADDPDLRQRFENLAQRTYELSQFLTDVLGVTEVPGTSDSSLAWHHSCHGLRGLGIRQGPLDLLGSIDGLDLRPLPGAETCCGFGGLFAVKFSELSSDMLDEKLKQLDASGADHISATDCSCLMHIQGGLERRGSSRSARHLAEVLADALAGAPAGALAGAPKSGPKA